MIAIAGFGKDHPISIYIYEKEQDVNAAYYKDLRDKLEEQEKKRMFLDIDD